jgi:hypothetical protein
MKTKDYKDGGESILFFGESWLDSNLASQKCWRNEQIMDVKANINFSDRFIVLIRLEVHLGTTMGN